MPSTSPKQARFMQAAAHNATFAKEAGIPQSVAKEFNAADKAQGQAKAQDSGQGQAKAAAPKGKDPRGTHTRYIKPYVSGSRTNKRG